MTPSQTSAGASTYSATVSDLKGGKEYQAIVSARNSAGKYAGAEFETPYVREFENIAGRDNVLVGAHYEPFFAEGTWAADWNASNGTPLLGKYNSSDQLVVSKHIDWATGHGIDFFALDWFGTPSITTPDLYWSTSNVEAFMRNPMAGDIQFMITFDSSILLPKYVKGLPDIDSSANRRILQDGFTYIVDNYFPHTSYLRIRGRHVVFFWASILWRGNITGALDMLRGIAKSRGYEVFLIGDPAYFGHPSADVITPWDAVTQWGNIPFNKPSLVENLEAVTDANYSSWSSMSARLGVHFIPSALPGYHYLKDPTFPVVPKSTQRLRNQVEIAKKYLDHDLRLAFLTTFNDWTENSQIEPSVEDGSKYLQTLRDTLAGH